MANQSETNDTSLGPKSGEREDSGLEDILAVAAKIKDAPDDLESPSSTSDGLIVFATGGLGEADVSDDDDGMFGSFSGGLGVGFGAPLDPANSLDLTPLGGEGSVTESVSVTPAPVTGKPVEEPKRNPLTALAVVLGLGLVAAGAVYLTNTEPEPQQVVEAGMSAKPQDDAAVGTPDPQPEPDPSGASGAGVVEPEPEPEPVDAVGDTEGVFDTDGEGLPTGETDGDPMAQKAGLLEGGTNPVAKGGKWDPGPSKPTANVDSDPDPDPDPEPDPVIAKPDPVAEPAKKPAGGGPANDDEVDCLLNPDLDKCKGGGSSKPKNNEILAPKLSESLDKTQLRDGFNKAKSKAKACGTKFGAEAGSKVKVHASIEGATGKVTSVEAQGEHAGTELGKCVEAAVKGATFDQFKKPSQGVDYSLIM